MRGVTSLASYVAPIVRRLRSKSLSHSGRGLYRRSADLFSSSLANLPSVMKGRTIPITHDYLTPQPSHLLAVTLHDSLPQPLPLLASNSTTFLPSIAHNPRPLPVGHHLVYFPTSTTASQLLEDGTDTLHSPGEPFTRRLWAGGRVRFPRSGGPLLDGKRAALVEGIRDLRVAGKKGEEKVFVSIERRVAHVEEGEDDSSIRARVWTKSEEDYGDAILIEQRQLCFLRDEEEADGGAQQPRKQLKPTTSPQYSHTFRPNAALLFRFSALTFNAHAIHIDPLYTRDIYKQPGLLIHGPLTLAIMLSWLSGILSQKGRVIREINYRNLSPLYVHEEMRICAKHVKAAEGTKYSGGKEKWEVWVEKGEGESLSVAVKGTVTAEHIDSTG